MKRYILAIDHGTTNSRAIVFDQEGKQVGLHEVGLQQYFPQSGWVEQQPEDYFDQSVVCCRLALSQANVAASDIAAIGITNQRETTIIWHKNTGKAVYPAIVWQDRRTSDACKKLAETDLADMVRDKTGLLLDPYFSATKIAWILDHVAEAREQAIRGELLFGTVDTYLLWRLTGGKAHATDASNASRTALFNIHTQTWDAELLKRFDIPETLLPKVLDNTADFGVLDTSILGVGIPIAAMAGDQQAATIGQACFHPGMVKTTFGTGCFMLLNTGNEVVKSRANLLATVAYRIQNKTTYGLEGSIFCAGVTVKWLRDKLKVIKSSAETEVIAKSIPNTNGVYLIPAFTGLGAPYWDPDVRGALVGLTQNSGIAEIVRAGLESVVYQVRDLLHAMAADYPHHVTTMRVDGGMTANQWLMQFLADMLDLTVERPDNIETTALGAAYLAGLQVGLYHSLDEIAAHWQMNSRFTPNMQQDQRDDFYQGWQQAIQRTLLV